MENLGSGTSQKDPKPAMDEPGTASVQTISSSTTAKEYLCERCESLSARIPAQEVNGRDGDFQLVISAQPLSVGCALCSQLHDIFRSLQATSQYRDSMKFFDFYCLATEPPLRGWWEGGDIYFSIKSWTGLTQRMFPTQGINDEVSPTARIVSSDVLDYQFIRTQLDVCDHKHGLDCSLSPAFKQTLRVIDCRSRQLVQASTKNTYACLSYVWGSVAAIENQKFDGELPANVPKTVEDAMAVTIALGISYLWVDRYCIDQGDAEEKHDTIRNMNRIYEGAEITIIAAVGDDPHHGLPGVRGTPRKPQLTLSLGGRTFVSAEEPYHEIRETKWATRGWTYQEMLLSRRRLVFTRSQVYFQCYSMYCMESLHSIYPTSFDGSSYGIEVFPSRGIGRTTVDLQCRLEEYYHRHLSFDTDIIDAFDGIVTAFDDSEQFPFRVTQFYGVPMLYQCHDEHLALKSFLQNISWYFEDACYKSPGKKKRKNIFPSWSWASAKVDGLSGKLAFLKLDSTMDDLWQNNDIEVLVSHRKGGDMNLYAFSLHKDKYQTFLPDLKITTWVTGYPLPLPDGAVMPGISQFDYEPSEYCYIAYTGMISDGYFFQFFAIILEEVEPEVFQRIGQWSLEISMETTSTSTRDVLEELGELIRMNDEEEDEGYTHYQLHWKRRTIRII